MGTQITKYETKNGKTRRVPSSTAKAGKASSPEIKTGEEKNNPPANPANKGA